MDKVIIHIGYQKTGSTWLQHNLFPKIENFKYYNNRAIIKKDFILQNRLEFNPKKLKKKYNNISNGLIISHELLVGGGIHNGGINGILPYDFCDRLYSVFPDAEIIIFIRNQPDIIASAYNQYLRGGGNLSISKYLYQDSFRALQKHFFFSFDFFKYDKIIAHYKKIFGENKVHIFLFEEFQNNPMDFVLNFCNYFDFQCNINDINFTPLNIKYRKHLKYFLRFSNLFYRRSVLNKYYLFNFDNWFEPMKIHFNNWNKYKIFGKFESSKEILKETNYQFIMEYYKASNRKLIEKHGLSKIKKFDYPL